MVRARLAGKLIIAQITKLISLHAIHKFQIAQKFPVGEEATYADIAAKCGIEEALARHIIRYAMCQYIFREPRKGMVAHTALSKVLADGGDAHNQVGQMFEEWWPASTRVKFPDSGPQ